MYGAKRNRLVVRRWRSGDGLTLGAEVRPSDAVCEVDLLSEGTVAGEGCWVIVR